MHGIVALAILVTLGGCVQQPAADEVPTVSCLSCPIVVGQGQPFWEPHIAVDPTDPRHLVAAVAVLQRDASASGPDAFGDDLFVARSRDGGASWTTHAIPHGPSAPDGHPLRTAFALADPNVAFLPDGTPVVSGLGYTYAVAGVTAYGQGFRAWIARIPEAGPPDVTVVAEGLGVANQGALGHRGLLADSPDAPTIAVAPDGAVHMSYRRMTQRTPADPESSIMVTTRSLDGGHTWSPEIRVPTPGNAVASSLISLRDGTLLAAVGGWGEGGIGESEGGAQLVARSTDAGTSWSVLQLDDERLPSFGWWPTIAASDAGVHIAYAANGPDGRERLLLANSTDGGTTFDAPVEIAVAPAPGAMLPTLGGDGRRAVLTWFEPQSDQSVQLLALQLNAHGASAAIVVDATLQDDAASLGEYFGVAVAADRAWPVWTSLEPRQWRVAELRLG